MLRLIDPCNCCFHKIGETIKDPHATENDPDVEHQIEMCCKCNKLKKVTF